jgi:hypothetical protein
VGETVYQPTDADHVWNRACLTDVSGLLPGDRALEGVFGFHNRAMNGGALFALELLSDQEFGNACAGYRYFGLVAAADFLEEARPLLDTPGDQELLEVQLDRRYDAIVPNDDTIMERFKAVFGSNPADFAPVDPHFVEEWWARQGLNL